MSKKIWAFISSFISSRYLKPKNKTALIKRQQALWEQAKINLVKSSYYKHYIDKPLEEWPIINKKLHVENFDQINTAHLTKNQVLATAQASETSRDFSPTIGAYSVGLSSGTSGNRGIFVASEEERALWAGSIIGRMLPLRLKKQKIAFFLRANNQLYETANSLFIQFRFFDLLESMNQHVDSLKEYQPDIIIAPPSVLRIIAKSADNLSPNKIISVAEVLTAEDKEILSNAFKQTIHQVYQCTEGFLASTCKKGKLHLHEDSLIIEKKWIDKEKQIFSPIITDLKRKTQPIIRYHLDDLLVEDKEGCDCGDASTPLSQIIGRQDDVLYGYHNQSQLLTPLFPDFVTRAITQVSSDIEYFKVEQHDIDSLTIYLPKNQYDLVGSIKKALIALYEKVEITPPNISHAEFEKNAPGTKVRRVQRLFSL